MAETEGPLFSSPLDTPLRKRRAPGYKQGYLLMLLWAIIFVVIFTTLHRITGLLFVAILFALFYLISGLTVLMQGYFLGKSLHLTLRTQPDLERLRQWVDWNMKFAYISLITFWPMALAGLITGEVMGVLLPFAANFIIWPLAVITESRLKNMSVESEDSRLADDYDETIACWAEPRFFLPPL